MLQPWATQMGSLPSYRCKLVANGPSGQAPTCRDQPKKTSIFCPSGAAGQHLGISVRQGVASRHQISISLLALTPGRGS